MQRTMWFYFFTLYVYCNGIGFIVRYIVYLYGFAVASQICSPHACYVCPLGSRSSSHIYYTIHENIYVLLMCYRWATWWGSLDLLGSHTVGPTMLQMTWHTLINNGYKINYPIIELSWYYRMSIAAWVTDLMFAVM